MLDGKPHSAADTAWVLDVHDDPALDALTRQAAEAVATPVALVSLLTSRLQVWSSSTGLPDGLKASRATSRCDSYCQFVVEVNDVVKIKDNTQGGYDTLPTNLVDRYGLRSYLPRDSTRSYGDGGVSPPGAPRPWPAHPIHPKLLPPRRRAEKLRSTSARSRDLLRG